MRSGSVITTRPCSTYSQRKPPNENSRLRTATEQAPDRKNRRERQYAERGTRPHAKSHRRRTTTGAKPPGHYLPDSQGLMTTRTRALVGSFVFFWIAPTVVAGVGPFALVGWTMQPPLLGLPGERVVGVAAVAAGLACLLDCFARFALEGRGTPAPVASSRCALFPAACWRCWACTMPPFRAGPGRPPGTCWPRRRGAATGIRCVKTGSCFSTRSWRPRRSDQALHEWV